MDIQLDEIFAQRVGQPILVDSLVRLTRLAALSDTGGANAASQVLLAAYNGSDYPLDISELGRLDPSHFEDAMNVMRLRVEFGREPHEFFANGEVVFEAIAAKWALRPE